MTAKLRNLSNDDDLEKEERRKRHEENAAKKAENKALLIEHGKNLAKQADKGESVVSFSKGLLEESSLQPGLCSLEELKRKRAEEEHKQELSLRRKEEAKELEAKRKRAKLSFDVEEDEDKMIESCGSLVACNGINMGIAHERIGHPTFLSPPDSTSSADNPHHESQAPEQSQHESPAQQQSVPNTTAAPSQATDEGRIARLKRTRKDTEAILQSIVDQKAVDRSCDRDINSIVSKAMYGGKPYNATMANPDTPAPVLGNKRLKSSSYNGSSNKPYYDQRK
eukprot:CAMPEP_0184648052 /NCGR_PEP_ID=MMETSP0308-20130426/5120_1 /TAXON_ID=38269 /ORGANISM="Gloeochaete witrockiana, Strain SAG 46.84" /LENGTH=280 /DNA_ID=CAMNT_0027079571 /DNA_START=123 /DNA_END=967 /DNA_ORIENTATION=-